MDVFKIKIFSVIDCNKKYYKILHYQEWIRVGSHNNLVSHKIPSNLDEYITEYGNQVTIQSEENKTYNIWNNNGFSIIVKEANE